MTHRIGLWLILADMALFSLIAFCLMGVDKRRARQHAWRIPEKTLFLTVLLGGGIGGTLGMWHFHHKTQHWYFRYGFPLIAVLQLIAVVFFMKQ